MKRLTVALAVLLLTACGPNTGDPRSDYILQQIQTRWAFECPNVAYDKRKSALWTEAYKTYWEESIAISKDSSRTYRNAKYYYPEAIMFDNHRGPWGMAMDMTLEEIKASNVFKGEPFPCGDIDYYYTISLVLVDDYGDNVIYGWAYNHTGG